MCMTYLLHVSQSEPQSVCASSETDIHTGHVIVKHTCSMKMKHRYLEMRYMLCDIAQILRRRNTLKEKHTCYVIVHTCLVNKDKHMFCEKETHSEKRGMYIIVYTCKDTHRFCEKETHSGKRGIYVILLCTHTCLVKFHFKMIHPCFRGKKKHSEMRRSTQVMCF